MHETAGGIAWEFNELMKPCQGIEYAWTPPIMLSWELSNNSAQRMRVELRIVTNIRRSTHSSRPLSCRRTFPGLRVSGTDSSQLRQSLIQGMGLKVEQSSDRRFAGHNVDKRPSFTFDMTLHVLEHRRQTTKNRQGQFLSLISSLPNSQSLLMPIYADRMKSK